MELISPPKVETHGGGLGMSSSGLPRRAEMMISLLRTLGNASPWEKKDMEWRKRYSKLYSSRRVSESKDDSSTRISFMQNDTNPYLSLLKKMRDKQRESNRESSCVTSPPDMSRMSSTAFASTARSSEYDDLGGHATALLNKVRRRSKELQESIPNQPLILPKDDETDDSSGGCVHGMSVRMGMTERSVSRSRLSRMSTKRDMDIPSILAFSTHLSTSAHLEIPAFQKINMPAQQTEIPRWSIRRSVCPVCSQKWKDRSSISNVKYSGLKRTSTLDLPSVIAPARLRTSIAIKYQPRPALAALDEDMRTIYGGLRNTSATWQLTRARRFRTPKRPMPPPEATAPPDAAAPLARKDLDLRVSKFLTDEDVKLIK